MLILFLWDLYKFRREILIHLFLNQMQVLLHLFPFDPIVSADMPKNELGVNVYKYW